MEQRDTDRRSPLDATNPFKPISYAERLNQPVHRAAPPDGARPPVPGQRYAGMTDTGAYAAPYTGEYAPAAPFVDDYPLAGYASGRYAPTDAPFAPFGFDEPAYAPPAQGYAYMPQPWETAREQPIPDYLRRAPLSPAKPFPVAPYDAAQASAPISMDGASARYAAYMPPAYEPAFEPPAYESPAFMPAPACEQAPKYPQDARAVDDARAMDNAHAVDSASTVDNTRAVDGANAVASANASRAAKRSRMQRRQEAEEASVPQASVPQESAPQAFVPPPLAPGELSLDYPPAQGFDPYARFASDASVAEPPRDEVEAFFGGDPDAGFTAPDERQTGSYQPAPYRPADEPAEAEAADPYQPIPYRPVDGFIDADAPDTHQPDAYPPEEAPASPFKPAQSQAKPQKASQQTAKPPRPKLRVARLLSLVAIAGLSVFCLVVGGRLVADLVQNDNEMRAFREEYTEQNGVRPELDAARVELLPAGQTYEPTASPASYATPTPTPRFAIVDPGMEALRALPQDGDETAPAIEPAPVPEPTPAPRVKLQDYPDNRLLNKKEAVIALQEEYPDAVGRLVIDGVLDQVVVMRDNTYYLTHNHRGRESMEGAVFVDESCTFRLPPENLLLRGQSGEGACFAALWQYRTAGSAFVGANAMCTLLTPYEEARYVLIAVVVAGGADAFNYASHPSFATDEEMLRYVNAAMSHSLYRFNVSVEASDRLLTLATVGGDDTLVLIYRMMRPGEGVR